MQPGNKASKKKVDASKKYETVEWMNKGDHEASAREHAELRKTAHD